MVASAANAAGLGKLVVLSALGEPFRAEIDLLPEPAQFSDARSTLTPRLASPDLYPLSGLRYNPALGATRLNIRTQANGRQVIEVASTQPLNEPFVHLLVELESNATRMVRGYTALLDPYGYRAPPGGKPAEYPPALISAAAPAPTPAALPAPPTEKRKFLVPRVPHKERLSDADAKTLAAMLERVAALEAAVAQLQRQWQQAAAVPAAEAPPAPPAVLAVPVAASPPPLTQDKPAAAVESASRPASSQDALLNNALLVLVIGLLIIVAWLAWVVWGPPSKEAKPQGKG